MSRHNENVSRILDSDYIGVGTPYIQIFMKFYIYVLKSEKDNSYYIGSTSSIEQRIETHNSGNVISTRHKKPWTLIYKEEYLTLKEAIQRERQIKSWKKRRAIERLIKRNSVAL